MTDIVGLCFSIAHLTRRVLDYLKAIEDAPAECRNILIEIRLATGLVETLENVLAESAIHGKKDVQASNSSINITSQNGIITRYEQLLQRILILVEKQQDTSTFKGKVNRILWPFKNQKEVADMLNELERVKSGLIQILQLINVRKSDDIKSTVNEILDRQDLQDFQASCQWLSETDMQSVLHGHLQQSHASRPTWILEEEVFRDWVNNKDSAILLSGPPGVGKTILVAEIVDYLHMESQYTEKMAVVQFFCRQDLKEKQDTDVIIRSLCRQLVEKKPPLHNQVPVRSSGRTRWNDEADFKDNPERKKPASPYVFQELFIKLASEFENVYILIDALDEFQANEQITLLNWMKTLLPAKSMSCHISMLISSRLTVPQARYFPEAPHLEVSAQELNIKQYIESEMTKYSMSPMTALGDLDSKQQRDMVDAIVDKSAGLFLSAKLHIAALASAIDSIELEDCLENLPEGLDDIYDSIIQKIQENPIKRYRELGMQVLQWVTFTVTPLKIEQLRHALAVADRRLHGRINQRALIEPHHIVASTSGLIMIEDDTGMVRIVHGSVQRYLESRSNRLFPGADTEISRICLRYLSLNTFADNSAAVPIKSRLTEFPLSTYAVQWWSAHWSKSESNELDAEIRAFLQNPDNVKGTIRALSSNKTTSDTFLPVGWADVSYPPLDHLRLLFISYYGMSDHLRDLFDANILDINVDVISGYTALNIVCDLGHEDCVNLLLERGADPNQGNFLSRTALHGAANNGHLDIIKRLTSCPGILVDAQDLRGNSPLHNAVEYSHLECAQALIEAGADVCLRDIEGSTALHHAQWPKIPDMIQLIIDTDPRVMEIKDNGNSTAFEMRVGPTQDQNMLLSFMRRNDSQAYADAILGSAPILHKLMKETNTTLQVFFGSIDPVAQEDLKLIVTCPDPLGLANAIKHVDISEIWDVHWRISPLEIAGLSTDSRLLLELVDHEAASQRERNDGFRAAAIAENVENMKILLEHGAQINTRWEDLNALQLATRRGNLEMVRLLVNWPGGEALLKQTENTGETLRMFAERNGFREIALFLREKEESLITEN